MHYYLISIALIGVIAGMFVAVWWRERGGKR